MTLANTEKPRESEKRPYSNAGKRVHSGHPHNVKAEEIRALFILVGWVGQRRSPVILHRLPVFDKGPGAQL